MKLLDRDVDGIDAHVKFIHDQESRTTYCELHIDGETYAAHAYCHPTDPFNKAVGRKLAFDRVVYQLARDVRTKLWAAYFERMN
jgi:hypothetical protein